MAELFWSVFPDHIICLEDGKSFKAMKRHLQNSFGMTPDQYRKRWGLPSDHPMVAPAHAEKRSALAKAIGPGRSEGAAAAPAGEAEAAPATAPKKRGGRPVAEAAEWRRQVPRQAAAERGTAAVVLPAGSGAGVDGTRCRAAGTRRLAGPA